MSKHVIFWFLAGFLILVSGELPQARAAIYSGGLTGPVSVGVVTDTNGVLIGSSTNLLKANAIATTNAVAAQVTTQVGTLLLQATNFTLVTSNSLLALARASDITTSNALVTLAYFIGANATNYVDSKSSNNVRVVAGTGPGTITTSGASGIQTYTINFPATNGFVDITITNGLATTSYVNNATNNLMSVVTNAVANLTGTSQSNFISSVRLAGSNYVTASVTNGLATTNYVNAITNGLATTAYVNVATNATVILVTNIFANLSGITQSNFISSIRLAGSNYVTASVTNGLATTNYVNAITNGLATMAYVDAATNATVILATNIFANLSGTSQSNFISSLRLAGSNYVTVSVTNGLATTNYANSLTNVLMFTVTNTIANLTGPSQSNFISSGRLAGSNYVTQTITNGLATTAYVDLNASNDVRVIAGTGPGTITAAGSAGIQTYTINFPATNGYVDQTITNGLATISYVNVASNFFNARQGGSLVLSNIANTGAMTNGLIAGSNMTLTTNGANQVVFTSSSYAFDTNQFSVTSSTNVAVKSGVLLTNATLRGTTIVASQLKLTNVYLYGSASVVTFPNLFGGHVLVSPVSGNSVGYLTSSNYPFASSYAGQSPRDEDMVLSAVSNLWLRSYFSSTPTNAILIGDGVTTIFGAVSANTLKTNGTVVSFLGKTASGDIVETALVSGGITSATATNIVAGMTGPSGSNFISETRLAGSNYLTGLLTNANQFGASTTLTIKSGVLFTNAQGFGDTKFDNLTFRNGDAGNPLSPALTMTNGGQWLRLWQEYDAESHLDFSSDLRLDGPGKVTITSGLQIPTGATNGFVLTSDSSGNATWMFPVQITNANQFGASTELTIKSGAEVTNLVLYGTPSFAGTTRITNINLYNGAIYKQSPDDVTVYAQANFGNVSSLSSAGFAQRSGDFSILSSSNLWLFGNYRSYVAGAGIGMALTSSNIFFPTNALFKAGITLSSATAADGYVLTSDSIGTGTWQVNPALGVSNRVNSFSVANSNLSYAIGANGTNYASGLVTTRSNITATTAGYTWSTSVPSIGALGFPTNQIKLVAMTNLQKVVVLGSSTAYGVGSTGGTNGWAEMLRTNLAANGIQVINASISGTRPGVGTDNGISRFYKDVAVHQPQFVIIAYVIGNEGIDSLGATDKQIAVMNYQSNRLQLAKMVTAIGAIPILNTSYGRSAFSVADYQMLQECYWQDMASGFKVVDFTAPLDNFQGGIAGAYDSGDGIHPNDAGHKAMFMAFPGDLFSSGQIGSYIYRDNRNAPSTFLAGANTGVYSNMWFTHPPTFQNFTMSMWLRNSTGTTSRAFLQPNSLGGIGRLRNPGGDQFHYASSSGATIYSGTAAEDTKWHHAVLTWSTASNLLYFYWDGNLAGSTTESSFGAEGGVANFHGRYDLSNIAPIGYEFKGHGIWRTAMLPWQVKALYQGNVPLASAEVYSPMDDLRTQGYALPPRNVAPTASMLVTTNIDYAASSPIPMNSYVMPDGSILSSSAFVPTVGGVGRSNQFFSVGDLTLTKPAASDDRFIRMTNMSSGGKQWDVRIVNSDNSLQLYNQTDNLIGLTIATNGAVTVPGALTSAGFVSSGSIGTIGSGSGIIIEDRSGSGNQWQWYASGQKFYLYDNFNVGNIANFGYASNWFYAPLRLQTSVSAPNVIADAGASDYSGALNFKRNGTMSMRVIAGDGSGPTVRDNLSFEQYTNGVYRQTAFAIETNRNVSFQRFDAAATVRLLGNTTNASPQIMLTRNTTTGAIEDSAVQNTNGLAASSTLNDFSLANSNLSYAIGLAGTNYANADRTNGLTTVSSNFVRQITTQLAATNTTANTNITLNFNQGSQVLYPTNNFSITNFVGLSSTSGQKDLILRVMAQGTINIVYPTLGAPSFGVYAWTNANAPMWTTLTNGKAYIISITAQDTNLFSAITLWQ